MLFMHPHIYMCVHIGVISGRPVVRLSGCPAVRRPLLYLLNPLMDVREILQMCSYHR